MSEKLNLLIAYPYLDKSSQKLLAEHQGSIRFLLDSGAFTAWKSGKPITLDDYCRFLEALPITPWRYFTLDVVGDPHATRENYETMLKRGFKPVPIFTRGGALEMLDAYYEASDLVGLGGVVRKGNDTFAWLKAVIRHAGKRAVHILGFTVIDWLKYFRPFSCDSSSYSCAASFGKISIYMGAGRITYKGRQEFNALPPAQVRHAIEALGFDWREMAREASWRKLNLTYRLSVASWIKAGLEVEQHLGTKLFLAASAAKHIERIIEEFHRVQHLRGAGTNR